MCPRPSLTPSEECKPTKCDDRGDDKHKGREESKNDDHEKQAKNDEHRDDREKQFKNDDHRADHEKKVKNDDHSKHAKNDDCQPHKDDCQPQKDHCEAKPSDDCGKANICHSPGEALAKFDFSHGDLSSHGPDNSSDVHGALASMSSDHALDYAINQMGPADHFDVGHFDVSHDVTHDTVHHA